MPEIRWSLGVASATALALVGLAPALAHADQPQLVVLRITGKSASSDVLDSATEREAAAALRISAGRFKVVTRDMLAAVVGEEKLLKCEAEARCELDLGVGLGTGYMLAGSIRKIGARAELTMKLYDVRKLDLLAQEKESAGNEEELLDRVEPLVERLTRTGLGLGGPAVAQPPSSRTSPNPKSVSAERKAAAVTTKPGETMQVAVMVRLPGGTYTMGETKKTVTVQPFLLDVTPVTVAAYEACVKAGKCSAPGDGGYCNWGKSDRASHPVNCVDWDQATAYCAWAGKRLPAEEEREWAARGAEQGTKYPWGNDGPADQLCWNGGAVRRSARDLGTCEVGSFPAGDSPQGLKDLAGNVWEWTSTETLEGRRATAQRSASDWDPSLVMRGGSWYNGYSWSFPAANRSMQRRSYRNDYLGFRCAGTP
jgi:formylglycine-generating enzyme required for sulfatase activity